MFYLLAAVIYLLELFASSTITVFLAAEFVNVDGIQTEFQFSPGAGLLTGHFMSKYGIRDSRRLPHITYVNRTATAPTADCPK